MEFQDGFFDRQVNSVGFAVHESGLIEPALLGYHFGVLTVETYLIGD